MLKAKENAERASEARSVFLAKMNHHLRTPLNAVIGYSELLLEDAEASGDEEKSADLSRIKSAGAHLLSFVTDVLDVGKISPEDVELLELEVDVNLLVDNIASACFGVVTANGNNFVIEKDDLGTAICDETRVRQIVVNLLSNAAKFTSNGTVTLRVSRVEAESSRYPSSP